MKTKHALLAAFLALATLAGCSSDAPTNNVPAPKPENSGMGDGSALKNKAKLGGEGDVGGRQIPKGK